MTMYFQIRRCQGTWKDINESVSWTQNDWRGFQCFLRFWKKVWKKIGRLRRPKSVKNFLESMKNRLKSTKNTDWKVWKKCENTKSAPSAPKSVKKVWKFWRLRRQKVWNHTFLGLKKHCSRAVDSISQYPSNEALTGLNCPMLDQF